MALLLATATFFGCSGNKDVESKKGPIVSVTDKTAKKVAERIRSPIDKAHSVKKQREDSFNDMEEDVKKR